MKKIYLLGMGAIAIALFGCAFTKGNTVENAEAFKGKTGTNS